MNALEKNIATTRGEALAANLLASATLRTVIAIVANKEGTGLCRPRRYPAGWCDCR